MKKLIFKISVTAIWLGLVAGAQAQTRVPIEATINSPGNTPPTWVSLTGFTGEADSVLRFDLYVQGFNFTNSDAAQYQIVGSNNGNLQARVTDRYNKSSCAKAYSGGSLTQQVHAFVDEFATTTGRKGIAQSKLAFKKDTGANSEIYVADFDGFGQQAPCSVVSPGWRSRSVYWSFCCRHFWRGACTAQTEHFSETAFAPQRSRSNSWAHVRFVP